jgi:2-oxo-4-hydroxy-4-carboxy--5-ureidoimidazoline (OHCU) decarboxylase
VTSGPAAPPEIEELNSADAARFAATAGPLFENAPRFLARLAAARPFANPDMLFSHARQIALSMPADEQRELVDAHPRIGAAPETVSALSHREQGYTAEADDANVIAADNARIRAELERLNAAYERRFGFRFVVFVAGRPRSEIIPVMERRLRRTAPAELATALNEIGAIAEDRWRVLHDGKEAAK